MINLWAELRYRMPTWRDDAFHWAARRLPRRLAYWSFIHLGANAIHPHEVVPEVRFTELLPRIAP